MLAAARKDLLLDRLRRDLRELDAAGLAVRVYGGALPASPAVADYASRTAVAPESKRRVAAAAVALIAPGATVTLDGGTTTLAMVEALPKAFRCTGITQPEARTGRSG